MPSVVLGEHFEAFAREQVRQGKFSDVSEVVRAGLRLLEESEACRQSELRALRAEVAAGLDSGEPMPADEVFARLAAKYGVEDGNAVRMQLTPQAERDMDAIAAFTAANDPGRAASLVRELRQKCRDIARNPRGYQALPELGEGIRLCAHGNCLIAFKAVGDRKLVARALQAGGRRIIVPVWWKE